METIPICFADRVNPLDAEGRTYRQINLLEAHQCPVNSLVELENGARLFVVSQYRSGGGSPVYALSIEPTTSEIFDWRDVISGWEERDITLVKEAKIPKAKEQARIRGNGNRPDEDNKPAP